MAETDSTATQNVNGTETPIRPKLKVVYLGMVFSDREGGREGSVIQSLFVDGKAAAVDKPFYVKAGQVVEVQGMGLEFYDLVGIKRPGQKIQPVYRQLTFGNGYIKFPFPNFDELQSKFYIVLSGITGDIRPIVIGKPLLYNLEPEEEKEEKEKQAEESAEAERLRKARAGATTGGVGPEMILKATEEVLGGLAQATGVAQAAKKLAGTKTDEKANSKETATGASKKVNAQTGVFGTQITQGQRQSTRVAGENVEVDVREDLTSTEEAEINSEVETLVEESGMVPKSEEAEIKTQSSLSAQAENQTEVQAEGQVQVQSTASQPAAMQTQVQDEISGQGEAQGSPVPAATTLDANVQTPGAQPLNTATTGSGDQQGSVQANIGTSGETKAPKSADSVSQSVKTPQAQPPQQPLAQGSPQGASGAPASIPVQAAQPSQKSGPAPLSASSQARKPQPQTQNTDKTQAQENEPGNSNVPPQNAGQDALQEKPGAEKPEKPEEENPEQAKKPPLGNEKPEEEKSDEALPEKPEPLRTPEIQKPQDKAVSEGLDALRKNDQALLGRLKRPDAQKSPEKSKSFLPKSGGLGGGVEGVSQEQAVGAGTAANEDTPETGPQQKENAEQTPEQAEQAETAGQAGGGGRQLPGQPKQTVPVSPPVKGSGKSLGALGERLGRIGAKQIALGKVSKRLWWTGFTEAWASFWTVVGMVPGIFMMLVYWIGLNRREPKLFPMSFSMKAATVFTAFFPILEIIFVLFLIAYAGCNYPLESVKLLGSRASILGAAGFSQECDQMNNALESIQIYTTGTAPAPSPGGVLSTGAWTSQINAAVSRYPAVDACILRVIVQKESGGQEKIIGCDCAANGRPNLCPNGARGTYTPDYKFNWDSCSYGIGLVQWTIYPRSSSQSWNRWVNPLTPSRNLFGDQFYTVDDFLDGQKSLDLAARYMNNLLNETNGDVRLMFRRYMGGGAPEAWVNERMTLYSMCKANGGL